MSGPDLPHGIYPYVVSPVDPAGRVMTGVVERLVHDLVEAGVDGITPLGSTGEVMYLTRAQREDVVAACVRAAQGRVPVVAGVAAFATHDAVEQAMRFEQLGVDGLVVMRQEAFATPEAGIVDYFAAVAGAVSCPIVIYSNPAVLGSDVSLTCLHELADIENIRYVKDATANTGRVLSMRNRLGERLGVFSASAHVPLLVFLLGGVGWMAGPACVVPRAAVELHRRFRVGDLEGAFDLQRRLWGLNEVFGRYPLGACIKTALGLRGYDVGDPLPPQRPLGDAARAEIERALQVADAAWEATELKGACR